MNQPSAAELPTATRALQRERRIALLLLFIAPIFFTGNMLMARATHELIPPIGLAFWRWTVTLALLLPFTAGVLWRERAALRREWLDILLLGALGMGVCGAFVYIGADTTTATNIGLIYAASPILIVLIARFAYEERLSTRQMLGVPLCLGGVLVIICRGDLDVLLNLRFTPGDLWIVASTVSWSVYSVLLRHRPTTLPPQTRLAAVSFGGLVVLLPFWIGETLGGQPMPLTWVTVAAVLFLALVASLAAYQSYARIQRTLGAGPTSLLMYLAPVYNGVLAWLLLDEQLALYHLAGAALVLPGIYLATRSA